MTTIKITQDGGVTKRILKEGQGELPSKGSTVGVQYLGTLEDGTEFDASSGYPFEFELGQGNVIKAWDLGIASMKQGEKAILTCSPAYGYGNEAQDDIPANSTLIFEVELVSIKKTAVKGAETIINADLARLEQIRKERAEAAKEKEVLSKQKEDAKKASAAAAAEKNNNKQGAKGGGKGKQKK